MADQGTIATIARHLILALRPLQQAVASEEAFKQSSTA